MKISAYTAEQQNQKLIQKAYSIDTLKPYEILIKIIYCGVCRSDAHFVDNDWGDSQFPLVPGHEVIGVIKKIGSAISDFKIGERVGVVWQQGACWQCEWCETGKETFCPALKAICLGSRGGFADCMMADSRFVFALPKEMSSEHAAPLLCAGSTVYHALTSFNIKAGMSLAIVGVGGLGHLAIQFAKAMGCRVTALTSSQKKYADAKRFGADACFSSTDSNELKKLAGQFDFILSTVNVELDYDSYIDALRPEGKFCFVGMPAKKVAVSVFKLIIGQKSVCASPMGHRKSIQAMLDFAAYHKIQPQIELMPLSAVNDALEKVRQGEAKYRIVLQQ